MKGKERIYEVRLKEGIGLVGRRAYMRGKERNR
jgi:hypothetical protein